MANATTKVGAETKRSVRRPRHKREKDEALLDVVEESLEESFPASDPPSWTVGTRVGSPK